MFFKLYVLSFDCVGRKTKIIRLLCGDLGLLRFWLEWAVAEHRTVAAVENPDFLEV